MSCECLTARVAAGPRPPGGGPRLREPRAWDEWKMGMELGPGDAAVEPQAQPAVHVYNRTVLRVS